MKRTLSVLAAGLFAATTVLAQPPGSAPAQAPVGQLPAGPGAAAPVAPAAPALTEQLKLNASYAIGVSIGKNLQSDKDSLDLKMVMQGLQDSLTGQELKLTDEQMGQVLSDFNLAMMQLEQQKAVAMVDQNKQEEAQFLAANARQPGVKVTASGLQYKPLAQGAGASPQATDKVKAHYHGTFLDGTVFDSSVQRGEPIELGVNQVIDGWSEALQMMKPGDKWQLWVPAKLAYGDQPNPRSPIPPAKLLVFEVELLEVAPAGAPR